MDVPPPPSRTGRPVADADSAYRVALVSLFVAPVVMAAVGVGLATLLINQPSEPAFGCAIAAAVFSGACAGIPGILAGRRALAATATATSPDANELDAGRRAVRAARWAMGLGIAASVSGALLSLVASAIVVLAGMGAPGRPFRRRFRARVSETVRGRAWCARVPEVPPLDEGERRRRAKRWLADARAEHASIASFCRVTLDLLALGAPPALVEQALDAARDEVAHARLAYELASAYSGEPLSPGPFRAADDGRSKGRLGFAASSLVDGWLNEGIAASDAVEGARAADNDAERGALERIAADETRHALLGRRLAEWAVAEGR